MHKIHRCFVIFLTISLLVGCSFAQHGNHFTPSQSATITEAYPLNDSLQQSAYPGPVLQPLPLTPEPPQDAPLPPNGSASISGVLFSYTIQRALPGTQLYLTQAIGPEKRSLPRIITGPELGDILAQSNDKGQFFINNVPPGNYYLFVWTPQTWTPAQQSLDDETPQLIELDADERKTLGIAFIAWP